MSDYERIARVIQYLSQNFKEQPNLSELAEVAGISMFHFQRMFTEWAGVSPKKFLQYISIEHAKKLLLMEKSISEVSYEMGFSGSSRMHDLFISIEGMSPGEFKNEGKELQIFWEIYTSNIGNVIIANTLIGLCYIAFVEDRESGFDDLRAKFPKAKFYNEKHEIHLDALAIIQNQYSGKDKIKLHVRGTGFQIKVWEALLKVPVGRVISYSGLSNIIGSPNASRAVGSAVGANPVAVLIPCHRVIRSTGIIGEYHWGSTRKTAILGKESAIVFGE